MAAADEIASVSAALEAFDTAFTDVEKHLKPLLDTPYPTLVRSMSPDERAKTDVILAYAINTLFFMYLRTQGVAPEDHPVKRELDRVKVYFRKIREHEAKEANGDAPAEGRSMQVNKEAASRFISHALGKAPGADTSGSKKSKKSKSKSKKSKKGKQSDSAAGEGASTQAGSSGKKRKAEGDADDTSEPAAKRPRKDSGSKKKSKKKKSKKSE